MLLMQMRPLPKIINSTPLPIITQDSIAVIPREHRCSRGTAILLRVGEFMALSIKGVSAASECRSLGGDGDGCGLRRVLLGVGGAEVVALAVEAVGAAETHGEGDCVGVGIEFWWNRYQVGVELLIGCIL